MDLMAVIDEQASDEAGGGEATRERIVQAARELIVERAYAGLSTAEVMQRAGVSRGGLYHHFAGKEQLIAAVLEAVEQDFVARLAAVVADAPDPMAALRLGAQWYLDECVRSRELQRVGLVEGRKALGWEAWREVIDPYGVSMLAATLRAAMEEGRLVEAAPKQLAYLLLAALHEAAALILAAEDRRAERERVGVAIAALLDGLAVKREL